MNNEVLIALATFAFVASITPGPNNLMLMASGLNFGVRKTIPHILGVAIGFDLMLLLVGIGIAKIFQLYPVTQLVLKIFSVIYLTYLAWKIANAKSLDTSGTVGKPFTFLQAALFQWVNPKAWAMGLAAISAYAPEQTLSGTLWVVVAFAIVNIPCIVIWAVMGEQLQRFLKDTRYLIAFNRVMALLLMATLVLILK